MSVVTPQIPSLTPKTKLLHMKIFQEVKKLKDKKPFSKSYGKLKALFLKARFPHKISKSTTSISHLSQEDEEKCDENREQFLRAPKKQHLIYPDFPKHVAKNPKSPANPDLLEHATKSAENEHPACTNAKNNQTETPQNPHPTNFVIIKQLVQNIDPVNSMTANQLHNNPKKTHRANTKQCEISIADYADVEINELRRESRPETNSRFEGERRGRWLREAVAAVNKPNEERPSFLRFIIEADTVYDRFRDEFQIYDKLEIQFVHLLTAKFESPFADAIAMTMPGTYSDFKRATTRAGRLVRHKSVVENEARTTKQSKTESTLQYIARLEILRHEYTTALCMDWNQEKKEKIETARIFEKAIVEHAIRSMSDRFMRFALSHKPNITTLQHLRRGVEEELDRDVDDTEGLFDVLTHKSGDLEVGSTTREKREVESATQITELVEQTSAKEDIEHNAIPSDDRQMLPRIFWSDTRRRKHSTRKDNKPFGTFIHETLDKPHRENSKISAKTLVKMKEILYPSKRASITPDAAQGISIIAKETFKDPPKAGEEIIPSSDSDGDGINEAAAMKHQSHSDLEVSGRYNAAAANIFSIKNPPISKSSTGDKDPGSVERDHRTVLDNASVFSPTSDTRKISIPRRSKTDLKNNLEEPVRKLPASCNQIENWFENLLKVLFIILKKNQIADSSKITQTSQDYPEPKRRFVSGYQNKRTCHKTPGIDMRDKAEDFDITAHFQVYATQLSLH